MADYFEEMSWVPLENVEPGDGLLQLARSLFELVSSSEDFQMQWPTLPPPASKLAVKNLKTEEATDSSQNCSICLKFLRVGEILTKMPCDHSYHPQCIFTWLDKTNSCPMCRHELPTDNPHYEEYKREQVRAVEREKDLKVLHNSMFM